MYKSLGCPHCIVPNISRGEVYVKNYLDKNKIKYIAQKKFDDLKDKNFLSYDFYLPNYKILIEYQGIQHYRKIERFGGIDNFNKQQYHDYLKADYANKNGYKLLEINYRYNTQQKVNHFLHKKYYLNNVRSVVQFRKLLIGKEHNGIED